MSEDARVWVVRTGAGGSLAAQCESHNIVAIGFVECGDATGATREELTARFKAAGIKHGHASSAGGQLWRFANEIAVGALVVVPVGGSRELLFGRITGDYAHQPQPVIADYPNVRSVEWLRRASRDLLPKRVLYSLGSLLTVFVPAGQAELRALALGEAAPPATDEDHAVAVGDAEEEDLAGRDLFMDLQARAAELIAAKVAALDAYEAQSLVAGVLRAMGYYTREAPPGADGGTDILAARDPLLVEPPILRVQVKAKPSTAASASDVRELSGVCDKGEHGIFVSTGAFTRDAHHEAAKRGVQLFDLERLQQLLLDAYDKLDQDTKALIPLRRIYFP